MVGERDIGHIDAILAKNISPKVRDYFKKMETLEMDEHRIKLGELTISEDAASCLQRWLDKMEFSPRMEIRSDRPGYRRFVRIDFKNPVVRAKWKAFIADQMRVHKIKANDTTRNAMMVADFQGEGERERKFDRPESL